MATFRYTGAFINDELIIINAKLPDVADAFHVNTKNMDGVVLTNAEREQMLVDKIFGMVKKRYTNYIRKKTAIDISDAIS